MKLTLSISSELWYGICDCAGHGLAYCWIAIQLKILIEINQTMDTFMFTPTKPHE
jgi:hypothetical protein